MSGFSAEQIEQLRRVLREELAGAGLRLDGPDHVDEAREDFRFVRLVRKAVTGVASKVGMGIIIAILGGVGWLILQGWNLFVRGGS